MDHQQKQQSRYWNHHHHHPWTRRKFDPAFDSWEERAFAEDQSASGLGGCVWPPKSYSCSFCRREFRSAQALGGHMNVHRRDRARLKQSPGPHTVTGDLDSSTNFYGPNPNPNINPDHMIIASNATIAAASPILLPPHHPSNKISSSSSSSNSHIGLFDQEAVVYSSNSSQILMKNFIAATASARQLVISSSSASDVELKLGSNQSYYNFNCRKNESSSNFYKRQRDEHDHHLIHDHESSTTEIRDEVDAPVNKKQRIMSTGDSMIPLFMRKQLLVPSDIHHQQANKSGTTAGSSLAVVEELDLELRLGERRPKVK